MFAVLFVIAIVAAVTVAFGRQLGHPSGWFGRGCMGRMLNQGNRALIAACVTALKSTPGERVLEVGFGGGSALELLAPSVHPARAVGVEISSAMLQAARSRALPADLLQADAAGLPFADASFDGALSINTVYFWAGPETVLAEFGRVLKPGGRLVLGVRGRAFMMWSPVTWFGFRLYSEAALEQMLRDAGFEPASAQAGFAELVVSARKLGT